MKIAADPSWARLVHNFGAQLWCVAVAAGAPGGLFGDAGVAQCDLRKPFRDTAKGSEDRSDSIVVGFIVNS